MLREESFFFDVKQMMIPLLDYIISWIYWEPSLKQKGALQVFVMTVLFLAFSSGHYA